MTELQNKVRALFDAKDIDIHLAWRQTGRGVQPAVFKPGDDLESLVFDKRCVDNLTNYLPELTERYKRVAVVAAEAGAKADALRIWRAAANVAPAQLTNLDDLADAGLKNELISYYKAMQAGLPGSNVPHRAFAIWAYLNLIRCKKLRRYL